MMLQKQPKHYKCKNEDTYTKIWTDIAILFVLLLAVVIVCAKRKPGMTEVLHELISINPFSALILLVLLDIVFTVVKTVIYGRNKKIIMNKGSVYEGKIEDTVYVKNKFVKSPGATYDYRYLVRLNDGRTINTEVYYEDFVSKDNISCCNVYEYNDRYYFTDFR